MAFDLESFPRGILFNRALPLSPYTLWQPVVHHSTHGGCHNHHFRGTKEEGDKQAMKLQEFLQSHAGTFVLLMASALAFYFTCMTSIWRWKPKLIVMGELMIVLLVLVAWLVDNLLATVLVMGLLIISWMPILLAWYLKGRVKQKI